MWISGAMDWPCLLFTLNLLTMSAAQSPPLASILPSGLGLIPVPYGPVPAGCSQFEILVGESFEATILGLG